MMRTRGDTCGPNTPQLAAWRIGTLGPISRGFCRDLGSIQSPADLVRNGWRSFHCCCLVEAPCAADEVAIGLQGVTSNADAVPGSSRKLAIWIASAVGLKDAVELVVVEGAKITGAAACTDRSNLAVLAAPVGLRLDSQAVTPRVVSRGERSLQGHAGCTDPDEGP